MPYATTTENVTQTVAVCVILMPKLLVNSVRNQDVLENQTVLNMVLVLKLLVNVFVTRVGKE